MVAACVQEGTHYVDLTGDCAVDALCAAPFFAARKCIELLQPTGV